MRSFFKSTLVAVVGALAAVYLANPTAGVFELIPDAIPLIGNLDEATATTLLLACLAHFGIDITGWLRKKDGKPPVGRGEESRSENSRGA